MSTDDTDRPGDPPWWASGRGPEDGLDHGEDPLATHRAARSGTASDGAGVGDLGRLASAAMDLFGQLGRRSFAPPHNPGLAHSLNDGQVCDACPVCIALRAIRQSRPEVISHLADATHHLSQALRAIADVGADATDEPPGPDE